MQRDGKRSRKLQLLSLAHPPHTDTNTSPRDPALHPLPTHTDTHTNPCTHYIGHPGCVQPLIRLDDARPGCLLLLHALRIQAALQRVEGVTQPLVLQGGGGQGERRQGGRLGGKRQGLLRMLALQGESSFINERNNTV